MTLTTRYKLYHSPGISPSMIFHYLEKFHFFSLFDPISSTSGGSGYFKLQNIRVISNDLALSTYLRGKALWENNRFVVDDDLIGSICAFKDGDFNGLGRFDALDNVHLTSDMKKFLDLWHIRIFGVRDEFLQALLCVSVMCCIDYWITTAEYGSTPAFDPPALLKYYIRHINRQVMNNRESNEMWGEDPAELASKVLADAMFLNPPPLKGYASYGLKQRLEECWVRGDNGFDMGGIAGSGILGSAFVAVGDYKSALMKLLENASHLHLWVFTLSNNQPFTQQELEHMIREMGRRPVATDIELPKGAFSPKAAHTVIVATG